MKKPFHFYALLVLICMNCVSNAAIAAFNVQHIQISQDTLKPDWDEEILVNPYEMPRFPGCEDLNISLAEKKKCAEEKMQAFIYDNLKTPKTAEDSYMGGVLVVSFIVTKEGEVRDAKVLRDIGFGWGREALRVIYLMPDGWVPGKFSGVPVDLQMNLPIRVSLQNSD